MKKRLALVILSAICGLAVTVAENYPYRSDYLWVTVPNHENWLYKTGENAFVEVQLYKYGIPYSGVVEYNIGDDMMKPDRKGTVALKNGRAQINIGSRKTPGFRDIQLSANIGGKTCRHHVKVGFSPEQIKPVATEPSDFMDFWEKNVVEMRRMPLKYTSEDAPEYSTDKVDCRLVKLQIDKDGHSLYGYLFVPKGAKKGGCPVVLCPPGAGIKTIKEPLRRIYYPENGFIRLEIDIHGIDPRLPEHIFGEISRAFNGRDGGYLTYGIDSRDRYYMKHVYLGLVRSIDLLTSLPEWDGRNVVVQGGSQGGALAIVAAALDHRTTQCVVNHPALSDMAAYSVDGKTGGYPHLNRLDGILTPQHINTLSYYDVVNFARHVKCPVYMTWGYNDNVCPPTTSYAVWNTLDCPKESLVTPINEHWTSDDTERGQMEWIKNHLAK